MESNLCKGDIPNGIYGEVPPKVMPVRAMCGVDVEMDGERHPLLALTSEGFSVDAESTPHLRGNVKLYEGARHIANCLIVRGDKEDGLMFYEYKRRTEATLKPPLDYAADKVEW